MITPVKDIGLTSLEIESLKACPASTDSNPAEGNRTAYIKRILKHEKLVRTLWVSDDESDEFFFTWQRTERGDEFLAGIEGGAVVKSSD